MKPHKHAELIKAWADGAEIQFKSALKEEWHDAEGNPDWHENLEYRIKPEPKPDVVLGHHFYAEPSLHTPSRWCIVSDQDKDNNILLTFDGETGELKSAEVLK